MLLTNGRPQKGRHHPRDWVTRGYGSVCSPPGKPQATVRMERSCQEGLAIGKQRPSISGCPGWAGPSTVTVSPETLVGRVLTMRRPAKRKGPCPHPPRAVSDPLICIHAATCWPRPLTIHSGEAQARAPTGPWEIKKGFLDEASEGFSGRADKGVLHVGCGS